MPRLHVCWTTPSPLPPPEDVVLSFLPCAEEERLAAAFGGTLLCARELSLSVRPRARALYLDLCAGIGASRGASGSTLREAAADGPGTSPWWWHPTSAKDCESDPAFGLIIAALTVREALRLRPGSTACFIGAPTALARAFSPSRSKPSAWVWIRALMSRVRSLLRRLRERAAAARVQRRAPKSPRGGAAFLGFWDWSVDADADGRLRDRYAQGLPGELSSRGLHPFWLCWLDPAGNPERAARPDIVLLQSYLSVGDVLRAHADLRPLRAYLRRRREPDFAALFRREDLDFLPLFEERLLRGFLDGCLPHAHLLALAAERAARELAPAASVSFLEHYAHGRAFHDGIRRGAPRATRAAFQHASFCREKTFYFLDPAREFRGEPDGRPAPCPDLVFAMGAQARGHFLSCGYPPERVLTTGNPRYDRLRPRAAEDAPHGGLTLLVAAGFDTSVEIDMVEAAVAACEGVPGASVLVRDHPFTRVADEPRFSALAGRVRLSTASLEEDLARADAVLFTYSTVAEEAALQGKTVWHWQPLSYDASALAEEAAVPRFTSAASLRAALRNFKPSPLGPAERERLAERLFHRLDGGAASRIAEALTSAVRASAPHMLK